MQLFCYIIGNRNLIHLRTHINACLCANGRNIVGALQVRLHTLSLCRSTLLFCYVVILLVIYLFRDRRSVAQQRWISFHSCSKNVGDTHAHYTVEFYGSYLLHNFLKSPL